MATDRMAGLLERMTAVVVADLRSLCECEAEGGFAAASGAGPLRFDPDMIGLVQERLEIVREARTLIGRVDGPDWLVALVEGRRELLAAEARS